MSRRGHRNELLLGVLLLAAAGVFVWLSLRIGALKSLGDNVVVTMEMVDAAGLVEDSSVKVAGVTVGGVKSLRVDHDKAVATLSLRRDAGLRRDVRAEVRARSLLGEKYLALTPRSRDAALLEDGDVIEDVVHTMEIDQVLTSLGPLVEKVDPDDVAAMIKSLAALSEKAEGDLPTLLDAAKRLMGRAEELAELVPALKQDVPAITRDLRQAAAGAERTLGKLDAVLEKTDALMESGKATADELKPLVAKANAIADELQPGVDDLAAALERSDELVARLDRMLERTEAIDEETIRRWLREEGVLVRLKPPGGPGKRP